MNQVTYGSVYGSVYTDPYLTPYLSLGTLSIEDSASILGVEPDLLRESLRLRPDTTELINNSGDPASAGTGRLHPDTDPYTVRILMSACSSRYRGEPDTDRPWIDGRE